MQSYIKNARSFWPGFFFIYPAFGWVFLFIYLDLIYFNLVGFLFLQTCPLRDVVDFSLLLDL